MSVVGTVAVCVRYPVKSVRGEELDRMRLESYGVPGDRAWALRTEDGKRGSGKATRRFARLDHMLAMSARCHGESAILSLPDGREFEVTDPSLPAVLGEVVGRPVTLTAVDGPHHDAAPIHLVTSSSLRWWSAQAPGERVGWPRARPNLVLDTAAAGRVEDHWVGRRLRIGSALLEVLEQTERCVMVTQDQLGLGTAPRLLRVLAPHEMSLGVYATVARPGTVTSGDQVTLEPP